MSDEREHVSYIRQRLGACRALLLGNDKPLNARLQLAHAEGFGASLTDLFPDAHADLRKEWEAIGEDFARLGPANVTLATMSEPELETLEARVLAFVSRYLAATAR
jgi:hypothetical protein